MSFLQEGSYMSGRPDVSPRLPPRWFVRSAWALHRAVYRLTGGRRGLWRPKSDKWGTMRLKTIGRRTGRERIAILGYYEDGPNLVTMAMNGWAEGEPAWWLNLQAQSEARVDLVDGSRAVRGRAAEGTNAHACGPGGGTWGPTSTPMRPGAPLKRQT